MMAQKEICIFQSLYAQNNILLTSAVQQPYIEASNSIHKYKQAIENSIEKMMKQETF